MFSLEMLNSYNCRIYIGPCPPTSRRGRAREQREKWMLGKCLAGAGSGRVSSGSAGNDLSLNWISCLEGRGWAWGGNGGLGVWIALPRSEESHRYHSDGVQNSRRAPQLLCLTLICSTHVSWNFSVLLICIKAEFKVSAALGFSTP